MAPMWIFNTKLLEARLTLTTLVFLPEWRCQCPETVVRGRGLLIFAPAALPLLALRHVTMRSIAKRLVAGMPAIAKGHAAARLEQLPVRALDRNPARYPERTSDRTKRCDLGRDGDLLRQVRFDLRTIRFDTIGQRTGRAVLDHRHDESAHFSILRGCHQPAQGGITEPTIAR